MQKALELSAFSDLVSSILLVYEKIFLSKMHNKYTFVQFYNNAMQLENIANMDILTISQVKKNCTKQSARRFFLCII